MFGFAGQDTQEY